VVRTGYPFPFTAPPLMTPSDEWHGVRVAEKA
jgi:hypothetical protein